MSELLPKAVECGRELAAALAKGIQPERRWVQTIDEHHPAVLNRVTKWTRDPRLLRALAIACGKSTREALTR